MQYSAEITGITNRSEKGFTYAESIASSVGIIIVRPSIVVGKGYEAVILGKDPSNEVSIVESMSLPPELTVLMAQSSRDSDKTQGADIETIRERVERYANRPDEAINMINESPFDNF